MTDTSIKLEEISTLSYSIRKQVADMLDKSGDFKVIKKFDEYELTQIDLTEGVPAEFISTGIVLDTETTGKNPEDVAIELGMIKFTYDSRTNTFLNQDGRLDILIDPGFPIPPEATAVNGITDDMVKGKMFDAVAVSEFLKGTSIIIAHNAAFDRPKCEALLPEFEQYNWACSQTQLDWAKLGANSAKLEYIAYLSGFFYSAHRADSDCYALLNVLKDCLPTDPSGVQLLTQLLDTAFAGSMKIWATGAPFDAKDLLKANGYRWNDGTVAGTEKAWAKGVSKIDYDTEVAWLKSEVYGQKPASVVVDEISPLIAFSSRRTSLGKVYL